MWQQFLLILAAFFLVLLNGFFVAAEFAIVKVRATQIAELANRGRWQARVAKGILKHLDAYLSATQLGITFASLGLGWIGEPAVARLLEPVFRWFGMQSTAAIHATSFAVAFAIISFFHIVLGELAPKSLAIRKPDVTSLWIALPLRIFFYAMFPAIVALNWTANWFLRLFGLAPAAEGEMAHSPGELRMIVAASHAHGSLTAAEAKLFENVMDFSERRVVEIMTPRVDIVCLFTDKTLGENIAIVRESQHTRFPLAEDSIDNVIGMVHVKDLFLLHGMPRGEGGVLQSIKRPILIIPEATTVEAVLKMFQRKRVLMGVVVDEFGSLVGLITLEDVLEELVGPIRDEFDAQERPEIERHGAETIVDGQLSVRDAVAMFPELPGVDDESVHTIAGIVLGHLGRLPKVGEMLMLGPYRVEVMEMHNLRITRLRLWPRGAKDQVPKDQSPKSK
jgi:CBS domain containing-hemolysin-like protein